MQPDPDHVRFHAGRNKDLQGRTACASRSATGDRKGDGKVATGTSSAIRAGASARSRRRYSPGWRPPDTVADPSPCPKARAAQTGAGSGGVVTAPGTIY